MANMPKLESVIFEKGWKSIPARMCATVIDENKSSRLKAVYIPDTVTTIGQQFLSGNPDVKIYGYAGSYALKYAQENRIPYVVLSSSFVWPVRGSNTLESITKKPDYAQEHYGMPVNTNTDEGKIYDLATQYSLELENYLNTVKSEAQNTVKQPVGGRLAPYQQLMAADKASHSKFLAITAPEDALESGYRALADLLEKYKDVAEDLGELNMSGSLIEVNADVIEKIRNNLQSLSQTGKYGSYTVIVALPK